jgi:hypothetical protein
MNMIERLPIADNQIKAGLESVFRFRLGVAYRAWDFRIRQGGNLVDEAWMRSKVAKITLEAVHRTKGVVKIIDGLSGDQYLTSLNYTKADLKPGILPFNFDRKELKTPAEQDLTMLGTKDLTNVLLKITFADDAGENIQIDGVSYYSKNNVNLGNVIFYDVITHGSIQAGEYNIATLPFGNNQGLLTDMLIFDGGKIEEMKVKLNNTNTIYDYDSRLVAESSVEKSGHRKVQDGVYPLDFYGQLGRNFDGVQLGAATAFNLQVKTSGVINSPVFLRRRIGTVEDTA